MGSWRSSDKWAAFAEQRGKASLALLALCLAVYLPGLLRLPPVDRTEIIWAESTRDMVARGDWRDPRYGEEVHQYRPIGTFWAQGVARWLGGDAHERDIRIYRLPSLIAVTLSVLAVFWLASGLIGAEAALIAAALFAVAPLTVLLSQLAIAESLSLLPATIAMLSLLRIYTRDSEQRNTIFPALLFWTGLGVGILINALLVPILAIATLIALYAMDRDLSWLKRLHPLLGLPIALAVGSPWLLIRAHQDGHMFAGLDWHDFLAALGGAQDMKLRAFPGTFILALLLGFIPGTVLLGSSAYRLWHDRDQKLARFLLAWVIGYLIYLEAISSKPGTYIVQTMFPALAIAVAGVVVGETPDHKPPKWHGFVWPTAFSAIPFAIFGVIYAFAHQKPSILEIALIGLLAGLFILTGQQGAEGRLRRWALTGVGTLGLLAITLLGITFPSIDYIWPSRTLASVVENCGAGGTTDVLGFREPSARFLLKSDTEHQTSQGVAGAIASGNAHLAIVEDNWNRRAAAAASDKNVSLAEPVACIRAYNVMRGCPLSFRVYQSGPQHPCNVPANLICDGSAPPPPGEPSPKCD